MELDLGWLLIGLPLVFALGWVASRLDLRQLRFESRSAPKAYFKGLNYLLTEQQDKAIDAFIEAVRRDPDTAELHFALGNLFRRRGEYDRAVRVHEHLLARTDLKPGDRDRAQHALALDFLKAGLLDRAEQALVNLEGTAFEAEARLSRLGLYERTGDWTQAAAMAQRLQAMPGATSLGDFSARHAHHLCEQAEMEMARGNGAAARQNLEAACAIAPASARAPTLLARWLEQELDDSHSAWQVLRTAAHQAPQAVPLFAADWARLAQAVNETAATRALLEEHYAASPSLDVLDALVALAPTNHEGEARQRYLEHLQATPSLVAAARWMAGEKLEHEQYHPLVQRAFDHAAQPLQRYRCAACGFESRQYNWRCPGCLAWDSYPPRRIEEI